MARERKLNLLYPHLLHMHCNPHHSIYEGYRTVFYGMLSLAALALEMEAVAHVPSLILLFLLVLLCDYRRRGHRYSSLR